VSFVAGCVPGAAVLLDVPPRVLFEIVNRCDIMVTNDTGPMHLAAATRKTKIVAIFGPENHRRYAPWRKTGVRVLSGGASCAPCTRYRCADMRCLNRVTTAEVIRAVDRCLDGKNTGRAGKPRKRTEIGLSG
jgi:ADP-heptose:LPS heptosyltransferase